MKPRKHKPPSYAQVVAERDAAVRAWREAERQLQALGAAASFQWLQGNPAPLEAIKRAEEGEDYHVSPNQLKLF